MTPPIPVQLLAQQSAQQASSWSDIKETGNYIHAKDLTIWKLDHQSPRWENHHEAWFLSLSLNHAVVQFPNPARSSGSMPSMARSVGSGAASVTLKPIFAWWQNLFSNYWLTLGGPVVHVAGRVLLQHEIELRLFRLGRRRSRLFGRPANGSRSAYISTIVMCSSCKCRHLCYLLCRTDWAVGSWLHISCNWTLLIGEY